MKASRIYIAVCSALAFIFNACNNRPILQKVDVDEGISHYVMSAGGDKSRLVGQFCNLLSVVPWNEMVVLAPYTTQQTINTLEIDNLQTVKDALAKVNLDDEGKCTLIFLQGKKPIAYSVISRRPVDMVRPGAGYYKLDYHECSSLMFEVLNDGNLKLTSIKPINL
ncbi:hypothetical protein [Mucilaginibacter auburnensis]|uniref:Lipoprotein n=1 Tax=Mucilaginibacter auburnensis TaxID=1457233 RepID=A0A2H9VTL7_9SPHI|nr:hypothetical protein [Mucilaginibacter auburnensis]PJJ84165.1 hypothetical protein CLV57_1174 [Mucilaginibacter auburnensis]